MPDEAPYAVDEQMRIEALRCAVAHLNEAKRIPAASARDVTEYAEHFLEWLLNDQD